MSIVRDQRVEEKKGC